MNSFVTALFGIIALCVSLFYAFGCGVEAERNRPKRISAFLISVGFAVAAIALLLVRA